MNHTQTVYCLGKFKNLIAIFNLGLSFLFSSPKSSKDEIPFAFEANKKITKN